MRRMREVGWIAECEPDAWADVLHFYGKDIRKMNGGDAVALIERTLDLINDEVRSSVARFIIDWRAVSERVASEDRLVDQATFELLTQGPDWLGPTGEMVEVTPDG